ncbi:NAD(P)H-dependent oxidoreductase [Rapidithrix thailandica]|uniref:FMN dependent NADH:quinone oxidoreductase n=1 Tax=Rapidithrix thailandica TaxID=413964 RepID=A0AAW9S7B1_9BACT
MNNILVINASARSADSFSRSLSKEFITNWISKYPEDRIVQRDLGQTAIPHITEAWIEGAFKPKEHRTEKDQAALKVSDALVTELKAADIVVLATPMYNWSIPSVLKAYIDQVLRMNETLAINPETPENPYVGLLENKKAYFLLVRGGRGYEKGEFYQHMNFQTDYLKTVFKIIGISEIEVLSMNSAAMGGEHSKHSYEECCQKISGWIHRLN